MFNLATSPIQLTAVPLATLSNGQKTVVFQGMQHVASEDFFKSVVFDLEKALVDGYTLFYEGVLPDKGKFMLERANLVQCQFLIQP